MLRASARWPAVFQTALDFNGDGSVSSEEVHMIIDLVFSLFLSASPSELRERGYPISVVTDFLPSELADNLLRLLVEQSKAWKVSARWHKRPANAQCVSEP
eukprot:39540-Eustigmatos_ZCMA.PRE.1